VYYLHYNDLIHMARASALTYEVMDRHRHIITGAYAIMQLNRDLYDRFYMIGKEA